MNAVVGAPHPYIAALLAGCEPAREKLAWLAERRAAALEHANALTVPTTRDEEWRFTDITPLTRVPFQAAVPGTRPQAEDVERFAVAEAGARLTFIDGMLAPELSDYASLPHGLVVASLAAGLGSHGALIERHLARHARFEQDVFAALNTARLRDGALIWIGKNACSPAPIHLLHLATQKEAAAYPRCLVVADAGSELTLIEDYASLTAERYFTNAVTEIIVGEGARVRHVRLQREAAAAFHIAACVVALAKDAGYSSHAVTLGARISRHNLGVTQEGEGVEAQLDGLTLIAGRQLADTHTTLHHGRPNGRSRQLHKCIIGGAAHAVFNGKIVVAPGAQLTNSAQESRNLLLSDKAHVDTKPQLEIFADDVKCAHGATVGQLEAEPLFYLRSRGVSEQGARNLLTYAFAAEIIDRIPVPSLVMQLRESVLAQTGSAE
jgi:Fe-S cluster assembly protein SufD